MYKKGHYADTYEHMYNTGKPTTIQTNKQTNKAFHQHTHQSKHIQTFKMQVKYKIQREKEKTQRAYGMGTTCMRSAQITMMSTDNTDKIHVAHTGSAIQGHQHQIIIQKTQNIVTNTKKYTRKVVKKHAQQDTHSKLTTTHYY